MERPKLKFNLIGMLDNLERSQHAHLWLNNKTNALVLTSDAYTMEYKGKREMYYFVTVENNIMYRKVEQFIKHHSYVCKRW